jgi:hypothetical protein
MLKASLSSADMISLAARRHEDIALVSITPALPPNTLPLLRPGS